MMSTETTERDADETTYNQFMALTEGDEFATLGSDWTVETVENNPRNHARVVTAARVGREHEWARFTADSAALTVTAELHDDTHERDGVNNTKHVSTLTVRGDTATDGGTPEDDDDDDSEDGREQVAVGSVTEQVSEGDELTVEYENTHGNTSEKSGTVTYVSSTGVNVDTGDETDRGDPITFRVTVTGTVESLTSGNARRISSGVSDQSKTTVFVEPEDSEDADTENVATDGGEDTDTPHTDALRSELADAWDMDESNISDSDVYQYARDDMVNADGELIVRFGGERDGRDVVPTTGPYKDYYRPNFILLEHHDLSAGVRDALDRLADAVDLRSVPDGRFGVFYVDGDSGRVTDVKIVTAFVEFVSGVDVDELETELVALANGDG